MEQMASTACTSTEYVHEVILSINHQLQTMEEMDRQTMVFSEMAKDLRKAVDQFKL